MKVKIDQLMTHSDVRGMVFEPIQNESLYDQENCHVVISDPGVVRGNHYHLKGTETIAVASTSRLMYQFRTRGPLKWKNMKNIFKHLSNYILV